MSGRTSTAARSRSTCAASTTSCVGGTGAGKSGLMWNPLRGDRPDDPRRPRSGSGWSTSRAAPRPNAARPCSTAGPPPWPTRSTLLTEFRDSMKTRQAWMRPNKLRACPITHTEPLEMLIIDELAMLTAYGDRSTVRDALRLLAEIMTQGRAADHTVWAVRAGTLQGRRRRPRPVQPAPLSRGERRLARRHGPGRRGPRPRRAGR